MTLRFAVGHKDQVTPCGKVRVGVHDEPTGEVELVCQVSGQGHPGSGLERPFVDRPAQLILDLDRHRRGVGPSRRAGGVRSVELVSFIRRRLDLGSGPVKVRLVSSRGRIREPEIVTRRGWLLFAAVSIVWGVPYLFIKIAVEGASPAFVAWSRVTIGAAVLLPIAWRRGALRGLRPRLGALATFAAFEVAIPFLLIAWGERFVSSSLAAILISCLPIAVAVLSFRLDPGERLTRIRLTGLLIGLAGVILLVGIDVGGRPRELFGAACVLVATVCYALGALIVKRRLSDLEPLGPITVALGLSAALLTPAAAASFPAGLPSVNVLASIVVLGIGCTATALLLYFALIAEAGPGRATVITYVNPLIAVVLGVALLGERIGGAALAGVALILTGSWLSTRRDSGFVTRQGSPASALRGQPSSGISNEVVME